MCLPEFAQSEIYQRGVKAEFGLPYPVEGRDFVVKNCFISFYVVPARIEIARIKEREQLILKSQTVQGKPEIDRRTFYFFFNCSTK